MSRNFGGGTVMVWAAFSLTGKTPICWISTKMNSEKYIELLEEVLLDFGECQDTENFIFQQDNAAIHVSRYSREWFNRKNIELLKWPARSPDLNPIENLWGILSRSVYKNSAQYENVGALKRAIRKAWAEIPLSVLQKLICSMKNRIFECIANRGSNTHY